jgi:hypothetical protein
MHRTTGIPRQKTSKGIMDHKQVCHTVESIFETGQIPEEMTWSVLVLIPKLSGGTRGIGLLDILWKVCSSITNMRLQEAISFHDSLHGFRKGRGTGTASLEAKLQMQLAHIRGIPLFQIFLDLSKAYDTMDRTKTIQLLQKYGVGNRILKLLTNFWSSLTIVARQQGYYGTPFQSERGTTQGDIISPTIFNIVIDAVRDFRTQFELFSTPTTGFYTARMRTNSNKQRNSWLIFLNAWDFKPTQTKPRQWYAHHSRP